MSLTTRFITTNFKLLLTRHLRGISLMVLISVISCRPEEKTVGSIDRLDPAFDQVIDVSTKIQIIAEGFTWSEGPVWVEDQHMLLFSDVPQDTVYKWTEQKGKEVYLTPSGYTGSTPTRSKERGSNGLLINSKGQLVLCQHGDRRVAVMNSTLDKPRADFTTLASQYKGKRFNSPNDAIFDAQGNLYITDPPYGLGDREKDPEKETPFQGVYKVYPDGKVILLIDSITRPNGIALTPDQKFLMVANSDQSKKSWYTYALGDSGVTSGKIFADVTAFPDPGLPDGMKINSKGIVFGTGPGGILVFDPAGKLLGKIKLPGATANCALSKDEKTLYITSNSYLLRLSLR